MAPEDASADWRDRAAAVCDPTLPAVRLRPDILSGLFEHARECYTEECCGLLLGPAGGEPRRLVRCRNVQSRRKARGESHLDARHGFYIDERELLEAQRVADREGIEIRAIYHSHVDGEAYLSHTDVAWALGPDGTPCYPGAAQVVVSVRDGIATGAVWFEWREQGVWVGQRVEKE